MLFAATACRFLCGTTGFLILTALNFLTWVMQLVTLPGVSIVLGASCFGYQALQPAVALTKSNGVKIYGLREN
jgi:hypothetical protein